jgi:hypothetical protein
VSANNESDVDRTCCGWIEQQDRVALAYLGIALDVGKVIDVKKGRYQQRLATRSSPNPPAGQAANQCAQEHKQGMRQFTGLVPGGPLRSDASHR